MWTIIKIKPKTLFAVVGLSLLIQIIFVFHPNMVMAENVGKWSWANETPVVFAADNIIGDPDNNCSGRIRIIEVAGRFELNQVCSSLSDGVDFGINYSNWYNPVIGFPFDGKSYQVNGACGMSSNCLYLAGMDILVTKQYRDSNIVKSLVVYKNFSSRLIKKINSITMAVEYDFDPLNPDYIFQTDSGHGWPIGGMAASDNSKWLAVEFMERGIGLLNMETFQMKRVSTMSYRYGYGRNPTTELAVSNDGKNVAIMGANAGFNFYTVSPECGDIATDDSMWSVFAIDNVCSESPVNKVEFFRYMTRSTHPRFNDDGGELTFYARFSSGEVKEVALRAYGYGGRRLDYLALGDSYSSGEGENSDEYYLDGTNEKFEKCHISIRSYPFLIADLSGIEFSDMKSVACSGAKIEDVIGVDSFYWGQGDRLYSTLTGMDKSIKTAYQTEAKAMYIPGRVHQIGFAKNSKPKVITIGIGGNDIGFAEKVKACINFDTCDWAVDSIKKEQSAVEIKGLFDRLTEMYQIIKEVSPESKIYAIGYPNLINKASECGSLIGAAINAEERKYVYETILYLNQIIESAAKKAGIKFVDISDSFGENILCGSGQPSAINFVEVGDDFGPFGDSDWFKFIGQESFHPNPFGHYLSAQSIIDSVINIKDYENCDSGEVFCSEEVVVPEPSTYWIPEGYHDYPTLKAVNFVSEHEDSSSSLDRQIMLDDFSLSPNSIATVEINSTPVILGEYQSNASGSLIVDVILPINLEEGYHTIYIHGLSYSGEPISLYQTIDYIKNTSKDVIDVEQKTDDHVGYSENSGLFVNHDAVGFVANRGEPSNTVTSQSDYLPEVLGISVAELKNNKVDNLDGDNESAVDLGIIIVSLGILLILLSVYKLRHRR